MHSRTLLILLLAAALAAGFWWLARRSAPSDALRFWHIQTSSPQRDVIEAAVARFRAKYPGVPLDVEAIKNDEFKRSLEIRMAAGDPPDVFHTWGGGVLGAYVDAGQAASLEPYFAGSELLKEIHPAALAFCRVGRTHVLAAIPADIAPVPVWYNREIFQKAGVTPPKTFAELLKVCAALKQANVTPLALGNAEQWPGALYFVTLATRLGGVEPFERAAARESGATFEHPCFVEAGRKLRALVDAEAFPKGFNGLKDDEARRLFFDGKAAMMLMGTWLVGRAKAEAPAFLDRLDCFAFPAVEGGTGDPTIVVAGVNAAYALSARSRHPQEAATLIAELASREAAEAWAAAGRIPARRDVPPVEPAVRKAAALLDGAAGVQLYYDQYLPKELGQVHKETTQAILAGTLSPQDAALLMELAAQRWGGKSGGR